MAAKQICFAQQPEVTRCRPAPGTAALVWLTASSNKQNMSSFEKCNSSSSAGDNRLGVQREVLNQERASCRTVHGCTSPPHGRTARSLACCRCSRAAPASQSIWSLGATHAAFGTWPQAGSALRSSGRLCDCGMPADWSPKSQVNCAAWIRTITSAHGSSAAEDSVSWQDDILCQFSMHTKHCGDETSPKWSQLVLDW